MKHKEKGKLTNPPLSPFSKGGSKGGFYSGMTKEEIIREYEISEDDIRAALEYACELIEQDEFHPLPKVK